MRCIKRAEKVVFMVDYDVRDEGKEEPYYSKKHNWQASDVLTLLMSFTVVQIPAIGYCAGDKDCNCAVCKRCCNNALASALLARPTVEYARPRRFVLRVWYAELLA